MSQNTRFGYKNVSARWRPGGSGPPNVNLGPPDISETIELESCI